MAAVVYPSVRECMWTGTPDKRRQYDGPRQAGHGERRQSAADVRLDGDEMTADPDDRDAGHCCATYIAEVRDLRRQRSPSAATRTLDNERAQAHLELED
jgi:hypothetical protein